MGGDSLNNPPYLKLSRLGVFGGDFHVAETGLFSSVTPALAGPRRPKAWRSQMAAPAHREEVAPSRPLSSGRPPIFPAHREEAASEPHGSSGWKNTFIEPQESSLSGLQRPYDWENRHENAPPSGSNDEEKSSA